MASYTEGTLVQQTTAEHLEKALGWVSVYACHTETFGSKGTLGRASGRDGVLAWYLRQKLTGPNPGLIADYCGILKYLRKALATFAGTGGAGHGKDRRTSSSNARPRRVT